ncbi:unnamed protein product [Phytophthora fragariaefolia]|uniref:Unnamed protein product n=1 Tax=Phytophthora fragariaefolia TaxID=1490495 RepID=A0A9W6WRJ2_9STRA|nr:unnamed protein product [Phytophthora fragariaefolia]
MEVRALCWELVQPPRLNAKFRPPHFSFYNGVQRQQFFRQRTVLETSTTYYICSRYRADCRARLIVRDNAVTARNDHTCNEDAEAAQAPAITDVRAEMRTALQEASLADLSLPPSLVWERVMASLPEAYPTATLNTIPRLPSISIVKYTRTQAIGSDAFRAIESVPIRNVSEDDRRPFLQFNVVHMDNIDILGLDIQTSFADPATRAPRSSSTARSRWCLARSRNASS